MFTFHLKVLCMCVCVCKWALTSASQILTDLLAKYTQFLLECSASCILEAWVQYKSIHNPRRTLAMLNWVARSNFVINKNIEQENVLPSLHFSSAVTLIFASHWPPAPWPQAALALLHFCCMILQCLPLWPQPPLFPELSFHDSHGTCFWPSGPLFPLYLSAPALLRSFLSGVVHHFRLFATPTY